MRIEDGEVEHYSIALKDKSRPPSRGGNRRGWHRHALIVGGETYSFVAPWVGKFVHKGETASFEWAWDETKTYRKVALNTLIARKRTGEEVRRGERGDKPWRIAQSRLPARRSEWKD